MRNKKYRIGGILCLWLFSILAMQAQYTVTGGNGVPYLAADNSAHKIKVYLVNGGDDIQISYTSSSIPHKWYRYRTKALEGEPVASQQNGNTSTVTNIEEGWGYYVQESDIMTNFVWVIDYNKYAFDIKSLRVSEQSDPCSAVLLTGEMTAPALSYRTPSGSIVPLPRQYEISYKTLRWSDESKGFIPETVVRTVEDPFDVALDSLLTDTQIHLTGDLFARHFKREKSISTDLYTARQVVVHVDTTIVSPQSDNQLDLTQDGLSAPATISFNAYSNMTSGGMYIWKIYNNEQGPDFPVIQFNEPQVDYTFRQYGYYTATLEVTDQTGSCTDNSTSIEIRIKESDLQVPNAFSPGASPGINDEFKVAYKSIVKFKGWIFNRWGVQLFYWTDPALGWDGKYKNKYVSPGVYFYVIEAEGSDGYKYKKSGDINILRSKTIQDESIQE
ncbi:gliding motility-associated C-terminal domain-containing protein [Parabacteroides sp. Marseille-P3160]|uniref:T9SS type B sorting domain-containing protein n=1 Tax=Parabacteroides sp. Marseille-P3160 TaxID=1917887 RepID=UPI0009BBBBC4|nr:gliding motility-associated C-terminal domain-containing protein [Parabacteroides sp. Marseille-P3160]